MLIIKSDACSNYNYMQIATEQSVMADRGSASALLRAPIINFVIITD